MHVMAIIGIVVVSLFLLVVVVTAIALLPDFFSVHEDSFYVAPRWASEKSRRRLESVSRRSARS
jgi:hypothetical protein